MIRRGVHADNFKVAVVQNIGTLRHTATATRPKKKNLHLIYLIPGAPLNGRP